MSKNSELCTRENLIKGSRLINFITAYAQNESLSLEELEYFMSIAKNCFVLKSGSK